MSVRYEPSRRVWLVRWRDEHGRHRSRSFPGSPQGRRDAQALNYDVKSRKMSGRQLPAFGVGGMYLDELAQAWINAKIAEGRASGWIRNWAKILHQYFLPSLMAKPVEQYSYDELVVFVTQEYPRLRGRALSRNTTNRYLNYLKMMFNFGIEHGHIASNPLRRWRAPKETPRQTMLTVTDLRAIMAHAAPHLRWALTLEWALGTRAGASELLGLQWQMVDWDQACIRIYGQKTRTWRKVPVEPWLLDELRRRRAQAKSQHLIEYNGRPIKKLRRSLATACRRAGISYPVCMTDIRHLFVTVLLADGADLKAVSALVGHADTSTTVNRYLFQMEGAARAAVASLPRIDDVVQSVVQIAADKGEKQPDPKK